VDETRRERREKRITRPKQTLNCLVIKDERTGEEINCIH
jgi:hypothetical protein